MLVRYAQSGVGPYDELLWVSLSGAPQVTRIVVSTQQSLVWGRRNWAIPKSRADFAWEGAPGREQVRVTQDGQLLAHLSVGAWGPSLPVTTAVVPAAWRTLIQPPLPEAEDRASLLTTVAASGWVRPARLSVISGDVHPALLERRPLLTVAVPDFRMVFPVPRVRPA
ncbi:hypothetical protein GLX28_10655 [Deinococcus xianganensis]|uniref:Uncharacterized protein n=2 Tax=Deinococcus xianganensis TaxID=1507289 RepID=A0A6I4YH35_9DEIO|nr:hypothetical protein [Deinococcus xianganensis]MXV20098.1 hypothetical protein [Deinococcus xianganensis]